MIILIAIFAGLLFLNLYFRIRILKYYRKLVENRVDFNPAWIIDEEKLLKEIVPKYPDQKENILGFSYHIRLSLKIASCLIFGIIGLAAIIRYA